MSVSPAMGESTMRGLIWTPPTEIGSVNKWSHLVVLGVSKVLVIANQKGELGEKMHRFLDHTLA